MPPRYPQNTNQTPRPLGPETAALHKLLSGDILEHSARILDHYIATESSKVQVGSLDVPQVLEDRLMAKCDEFEDVCDQIYFILEQSKRILQLDWQQRTAQQAQANAQQQQQQQQQQAGQGQDQSQQQDGEKQASGETMDQDMDIAMMDPNARSMMDLDPPTEGDQEEEEDMEELLQLQRERLDRLRSVVIQRVDVETIKGQTNGGGQDDLLF